MSDTSYCATVRSHTHADIKALEAQPSFLAKGD